MIKKLCTVAATLALMAAIVHADTLYLADGSTIKGKLIGADADSVRFRTEFGRITIARERVVRIDLVDGAMPTTPVGVEKTNNVPETSAAPGSLIVNFDGVKLSSTVEVHRGRDRAALEQENTIETYVTIDGKTAHSSFDTGMDKTVREGPKTLIRNVAEPRDIRIAVPSGPHSVSVVVANTRVNKYRDRFVTKPLRQEVTLETVVISAGGKTIIDVVLEKKKMGLAGKRLVARLR